MARICARCRQPVTRGDDHVCLDDDDPQDSSDEDEAA
jgi:hypothetical protein